MSTKATTLNSKKSVGALVKDWMSLVGIAILIVVFSIISYVKFGAQYFLTWSNWKNILLQSSTVAIVALGQSIMLLTGNFDLSLGRMVCLTSCVGAILMKNVGMSTGLAILIMFAIGLAVGAVNGFMVSYVGVPAMIATLGTQYICYGLAKLLTQAVPIANMPDSISFLGRGYIFGGVFPVWVLLMIIVEIIFYAEHRERKRKNLALPGLAAQFPLRLLIFLAYLVDCMQDAFVSILANQLYTPILGIPQSVGAALPLSAQVFAAAVMAFLGGGLSRKAGVKKTLVGGFLLEITGCLLCGAGGTYFSLLGGKAVIGMGLGLIIVSLNAIAARGEDEAESAKAFTDISAGTLAGVTAGAGVGSIILSFGHYSMVYFAGAAILLIGLALSFSGRDYKEAAVAKAKEEVGFFRFLFNRQVITFLLLMLLPFLMGLSFREYFFPIYAAELGMSETMIGRLYLICGLLVIYAGPQLTGKLIARLGGKWTVTLASALIIAAPLLYVAIPTLATTIVGVLLLSVAISFGYAAQSTYYSELPSVEHYGGGRAMGIYSLFENIGQTLGPMIYGLAMMLGYRSGLGLIGGAMLALLLLFLACNGKKKDS